ncbi:DUF2254 domain-containing protein [Streptomyces sp. NBC_01077]|uniref:DUF2254 family protein n=1 Tax=Streptomyces sp. NBC_01077 TaxID=2903746 RepID=UPI0038637E71|nr:DUF2254 domain-containing protein [Streptomyces sp. NBC_01077]
MCAAAGFVLGLLVPEVTGGPQVDAGQVVTFLFTIGFGVISLVSIIYSMLFLVVQFSASMFTPRLGLFRDEPVVWRTFAVTVGVFVFAITAALAIGTRGSVSVLVPTVAMMLLLAALGLMWSLQTRAFSSIQLAHALTAITTRAYQVFAASYPLPYDPRRVPPASSATPGLPVRWTGVACVVQRIDVPLLVGMARERGSSITFRVRTGETLSWGATLAEVTGGRVSESELRGAVTTGVERTFDHDPELPFRILADITLRALSPAVNDPATAVESLNRIEDLLTRLADRDLEVGRVTEADGTVRVTVPAPDWDRFVRTAVDDVIIAAAASPMTLLHLRAVLHRVAERSPETRRRIVQDRLHWVERTGRGAHPLIWAASVDPSVDLA